jgi:hypothetical protein
MERFNLKKLNYLESKEKNRVKTSYRFAGLKKLDFEVEINSTLETIRENIKLSAKESYYESKKHSSKLLDQGKQAELQWLQDPSEINGVNLNNVRREASRHIRNKKREYLKDKIN